jgi:hypothetical protein
MENRHTWMEIYRSIGIKLNREYFSMYLADDVGVLMREGPREIQYFNVPRFGIQDEEYVHMKFKVDKVYLEKEFLYIILEVRRDFAIPGELRKAQETCSELFAILALLYGPGILEKRVFEGFKFTPEQKKYEAPYSLLYETQIAEKDFMTYFPLTFKNLQSHGEKAKTEIALRWYHKGLDTDQQVDQFLNFWVSLEALTMSTTDIKEIPITLKKFLSCTDENLIKEKLKIGRIYGCRCDIVHNGITDFNLEYLAMLRNIIEEILRYKLGLPIKGDLEKYFR